MNNIGTRFITAEDVLLKAEELSPRQPYLTKSLTEAIEWGLKLARANARGYKAEKHNDDAALKQHFIDRNQ